MIPLNCADINAMYHERLARQVDAYRLTQRIPRGDAFKGLTLNQRILPHIGRGLIWVGSKLLETNHPAAKPASPPNLYIGL